MWKQISLTLMIIIVIQTFITLQYSEWFATRNWKSNQTDFGNKPTTPNFNPEHEGTSGSLWKGIRFRSFPSNLTKGKFESNVENDKLLLEVWNSLPKGEENCENWGVVTTIFEPTEAIRKLTKKPGYCVVIVTDRKTPEPYDGGERTVVLTVKHQMDLAEHDQFVSKLPWNHFGRKNIGFLYAIFRKAKLVFDFDDDNEILSLDDESILTPLANAVRLELNGSCKSANVYPMMKATYLPSWPRGLPLPDIIDPRCSGIKGKDVSKQSRSRIAVYQALANHDPDVDAIYRLTKPLPFYFQNAFEGRGIFIPLGILSPYNAQAALHDPRAYWSMYLPVTVHGRVSDIWRGYFAQRLMWDAGLRLSFAPPWVVQHRNPHNYLADFEAERDLYMRSGKLIDILLNWSGKSDNFAGRIEELWIDLYERGLVERQDVELIQLWLTRLASFQYDFPDLEIMTIPTPIEYVKNAEN